MDCICRYCNAERDRSIDAPFFQLNPETNDMTGIPFYTRSLSPITFCSTACLKAFVCNNDNCGAIAWFDHKVFSRMDIDYPSTKLSFRGFVEHKKGQIGCTMCDEVKDSLDIKEKSKSPYLFVFGYPLEGSAPFCSEISCLINYCSKNKFDAKNYWISRDRTKCEHCQILFRDDDRSNVGAGVIILNANKGGGDWDDAELDGHAPDGAQLVYCSAQCLVDYMEIHIGCPGYWVSTVVYPELRNVKCTYCQHCGHSSSSGPYMAVDVPFGSIWDNCEKLVYFASKSCLVEAFKLDAKNMKDCGIGNWYKKEK